MDKQNIITLIDGILYILGFNFIVLTISLTLIKNSIYIALVGNGIVFVLLLIERNKYKIRLKNGMEPIENKNEFYAEELINGLP